MKVTKVMIILLLNYRPKCVGRFTVLGKCKDLHPFIGVMVILQVHSILLVVKFVFAFSSTLPDLICNYASKLALFFIKMFKLLSRTVSSSLSRKQSNATNMKLK